MISSVTIGRLFVLLGLSVLAGAAAAEPLVDGDAQAGERKAAPCAACHGPQGNSNNPLWPKIAGQDAPYLYRQLRYFRDGERQNPIMAVQVADLSDRDLKDLAVYFSQQSMQPSAAGEQFVDRGAQVYRAGDPEEGIPACAGCHGPAGLGNAAAAYPRIGGQHAAYVAAQLEAYREGARTGYPAAEIMVGVSENLSDADIEAVASYVQGLQLRQPAEERRAGP